MSFLSPLVQGTIGTVGITMSVNCGGQYNSFTLFQYVDSSCEQNSIKFQCVDSVEHFVF